MVLVGQEPKRLQDTTNDCGWGQIETLSTFETLMSSSPQSRTELEIAKLRKKVSDDLKVAKGCSPTDQTRGAPALRTSMTAHE